MRLLVRLLIVLFILAGITAAAWKPTQEAWKKQNQVEYKKEQVNQGDVVGYVTATGKLKPVETILIGSFVSGNITYMPPAIDFNRPIKEGALMAVVDERLYKPAVDGARASLEVRRGEVERAEAQLQQAVNNEERAKKLRERKQDFVSDQEMDQLRFGRMQLDAALTIAKASVKQAQASLENAETNLRLTEIVAPKDGIIIDRKIEPGQTLASSFQTPELFEIGVGMREKMHIYASVDENDIGRIQRAKANDQPVTFTVSAYPDELFHGKTVQIRMNATETQAVVTYPVIVETPNPDLKLLPGMTANLSFQIEERKDVMRVHNQALRFYPKKEQVREEDHKILDGSAWTQSSDEENDDDQQVDVAAETRTRNQKSRNKRHVWVQEGEKLRAIEIETGVLDQKDGKFTELVKGDLEEGRELVVGIKKKEKGFWGR